MALLLGIDIGTSSVKAVLFDPETSQTLAAIGEEYMLSRPRPNWAEQDPDDWWRATVTVVRKATAAAGRTDIAAIGFSGQMHGATLIDQAGRPLRPAMIWADQRTGEETRHLIEAIGRDRYAQTCGTLPAAGFTGPILLWLAKHEPETLSRAHRVLHVKDYVRLRMTGEAASEYSDAAGSGLLNIAQRAWAYDILDQMGLPARLFAPLSESSAVGGQLLPEAAEALGLAAGIAVTMGCGDQPAQAVANGLITPGAASVTVGSGGQVFVPLMPRTDGSLPTDTRLHVFNHAVPGLYFVLGATLSAGLSLRWLRDVLGLTHEVNAYEQLSIAAAQVPPGADGLIFLPYLTGERTPHMDAQARGGFIGLSAAHGRGHLARAIMEGVSFSLRQALEISLSLGGSAERIIGAGGAMDSDIWRGIMTDVLGLPLQKPLLSEQAGVGAALVAGVGAGVYRDFAEAKARVTRYSEATEPDPHRHAAYDERYAQFVSLYPTLQADLHRLVRTSL